MLRKLSRAPLSTILKYDALPKAPRVHVPRDWPAHRIGEVVDRGNAVVSMIDKINAPYAHRHPKIVHFKYDEMRRSMSNFFRATPALFYADAAATRELLKSLMIVIMGDMHIGNNESYLTRTDTRRHFALGIGDLDHACRAPSLWEVARSATSILIAGKDGGLEKKHRVCAMEHYIETYFERLKELRKASIEELRAPLNSETLKLEEVRRLLTSASRRRPDALMRSWTDGVHFHHTDKLLPIRGKELAQDIKYALRELLETLPELFPRPSMLDATFRIAGMDSLGLNRFDVIVEHGTNAHRPIREIIELKEARDPAAKLVLDQPTINNAERVLGAAHYFVPDSEDFLGTTKFHGRGYYVRRVSPFARKFESANYSNPEALLQYAEVLAFLGAQAHARSGMADELYAQKKSLNADELVTEFARSLYKQTRRDYRAFCKLTAPSELSIY